MNEFFKQLLKKRNEYSKTGYYKRRQFEKALRNLKNVMLREIGINKILNLLNRIFKWIK